MSQQFNPNLLKQAQGVQSKLLKLREEMKERVCDASSGGGLVTAFTNGNSELVKLSIRPDAVDPDDLSMLEDLIVAAVQKAQEASREMQQAEMDKVTGGLSIPGLF
jgi:DNA-binding YbaB/EbfC family protein